jgi:hypothetical protein
MLAIGGEPARSAARADRPPRLMARKPSSADALRPALEGENK